MKKPKNLPVLGVSALLSITVAGCKPKSVDINELGSLQQRNAALLQEIAQMQVTIRRAGQEEPELQEKLNEREKELVQAYEELKKLQEQETALRMRRLQLEGRLESFRAQFRELQTIAAPTDSTQP